MARLEDMLPPGEIVRWKSPKLEVSWAISGAAVLAGGGLALFASLLSDASEPGPLLLAGFGMAGIGILIAFLQGFDRLGAAKLAITEAHVVWIDGVGGEGAGKAVLRDIGAIDAEEGGATLSLYLDGKTRRIEEIGGDVEGAARATGRPARLWRECRSRGAVLARRRRIYVGVAAAGLSAAGILGLLFLAFGAGSFKGLGGAMLIAGTGLSAQWLAGMAKRTLPHLLVGRTLTGDDRRDFVGWMTDLRWQGVRPDGPDDERLPHSRLEQWAMRLAYGEIPDIGEREPEILIPGTFPAE